MTSSLKQGQLQTLVARAKRSALESGAIKEIDTQVSSLESEGHTFAVRIAESLRRKSDASHQHSSDFDPFLPYEPALFVADLSDTHVCLLNKFSVLDDLLLIVTREFQEQSSALNAEDFQAVLACMRELRCLAFFNGGPQAGASQRHKHLQIAPLPLCDWADLPLGPEQVEQLGVPCHVVSAPHGGWTTESLLAAYTEACPRAARSEVEASPPAYNLLIADEWLMAVPRFEETAMGISINALAFAGSLFVADAEQLELVRAEGPGAMLRSVTRPK